MGVGAEPWLQAPYSHPSRKRCPPRCWVGGPGPPQGPTEAASGRKVAWLLPCAAAPVSRAGGRRLAVAWLVLSPPYRKCKLVTSGPWLEVAPIPLRDVSIIPERPGANGSGHSIALWAASDKGDVLCRLGVSELNPAVSTRVPASGDHPPCRSSRGSDRFFQK